MGNINKQQNLCWLVRCSHDSMLTHSSSMFHRCIHYSTSCRYRRNQRTCSRFFRMVTTSSQVQLYHHPTQSDYTSTQCGKQLLSMRLYNGGPLPVGNLPLPNRNFCLHGQTVGTIIPSRYASLDLRSIFHQYLSFLLYSCIPIRSGFILRR